jgi:hypothetical protein
MGGKLGVFSKLDKIFVFDGTYKIDVVLLTADRQ